MTENTKIPTEIVPLPSWEEALIELDRKNTELALKRLENPRPSRLGRKF
jgi:hypothetical protein